MRKDTFGGARSGKSVTTDFFDKKGNNKSRQTTKSDAFVKNNNNTQTFSASTKKQMNDFEKEYQEFLESLKKKKSQDE